MQFGGDSGGVEEFPKVVCWVCVCEPCLAGSDARVHAYKEENQVLGDDVFEDVFFLAEGGRL